MRNTNKLSFIKEYFYIISIVLLGCVGVVFTTLYIQTFSTGFVFAYSKLLNAVSVGIIATLTAFTLAFIRKRESILYKIFFLCILTISILSLGIYLLNTSGFLDKIDSVEDFRQYISSYGGWAISLFVLIQFLQVVVLPIPSFITVGAGVLLFGPFWGSIYSCIGIITGSLIAYLIGRVFGVKIAKWLVGEQALDKGLKTIQGKDKIILTFMFLFPFFPDDLLCFVAGITTISPIYFTVMIILTRIICIFASSYSFNNSLIPYNTWWGILLWILFFAITIICTILIYNHGEKIENIFNKKR